MYKTLFTLLVLILWPEPATYCQVLSAIQAPTPITTLIITEDKVDPIQAVRFSSFYVGNGNKMEVLLSLPNVRETVLFDTIDTNTLAVCAIGYMGRIDFNIFKLENERWQLKKHELILPDENIAFRDTHPVLLLDKKTLRVSLGLNKYFLVSIDYLSSDGEYFSYNPVENKKE